MLPPIKPLNHTLSPKTGIICLLEILRWYSDIDHTLTMPEIRKKLEELYGIKKDRRTVYADMAILRDIGYDISAFGEVYTANGKTVKIDGYYLKEHPLETHEIRLLIDAVCSSKSISQKATSDLIGKLQCFNSEHAATRFEKLRINKQYTKTANKQAYSNIDLISEAIADKRKIDFHYLKYDLDKKLIPRKDRKYTVSPYYIIWANDYYYLICNTEPYEDISHYRIDKMGEVRILEDTEIVRLPQAFDINEYIERSVYMYAGERESIELICDMSILDDVIEMFGNNINLSRIDDTAFRVRFFAHADGVLHWALQYLNACEVVEPVWLREKIKDIVEGAKDKYLD